MWRKKEIMNEIVKINYQPEEPTIPARDLHKALGITKKIKAFLIMGCSPLFKKWYFPSTKNVK